MPKRYLLLLVPGLLALAIGVTNQISGPEARTREYYAFHRGWVKHWPLEHGRALPLAIQPAMRPFAPVWLQVEPKIKMLLDPDDYVSRTILEKGAWESDSWAAIQDHLGSGGTFVDVGAHIGYYSLKAVPLVGPSGHVIAIEPNPETISKLRGNVAASGANTVMVEPVACSDAEATLELFGAPRSNTGETSLSRTNASQDSGAVTSYHVRARPLDDIIRETGVTRVDALKIDVEGAELMVLKGAQDTLARFHPVVLIEIKDEQLRSMGTSAKEVYGFFSSHGYSVRRSIGDNVELAPDAAAAVARR